MLGVEDTTVRSPHALVFPSVAHGDKRPPPPDPARQNTVNKTSSFLSRNAQKKLNITPPLKIAQYSKRCTHACMHARRPVTRKRFLVFFILVVASHNNRVQQERSQNVRSDINKRWQIHADVPSDLPQQQKTNDEEKEEEEEETSSGNACLVPGTGRL